MTEIVLGTANLFGVADAMTSRAVLAEALRLGFPRIDTAPSYGYGASEIEVARVLRAEPAAALVSTKVGIEAGAPPGPAVRAAKAVGRRLPTSLQQRLRGDDPAGHGHFSIEDVRRSVERSLERLPGIDRLLLHEPRPQDITVELVEELRGYRDRGLVAAIGVAGPNDRTRECLDRAPDFFDVVHLAVGPATQLPDLPARVVRVGHGALGPAGSALRAVRLRLDRDLSWAARWRDVAEAGGLGRDPDPAMVLVARAVGRGLDQLIVATSRPERLTALRSWVDEPPTIGAEMTALLDEACQ